MFVFRKVKGQELHKTWSKIFEAGRSPNQMISCPSCHPMKFLEGVEPRSMSHFSKFVTVEISSGEVYLRKGTTVYKVWPKVSEIGESKPMSDFSRLLNSRITLWDIISLNNVSLSTQPNFLLQNSAKRGSWSRSFTAYQVFFNLSFQETKSESGRMQMETDRQFRKYAQT